MTLPLVRCSIAETLGSGKHSTVYKARRRKTIAFCAIKRVEKSQKDRVLQEVRSNVLTLHRCLGCRPAWSLSTLQCRSH